MPTTGSFQTIHTVTVQTIYFITLNSVSMGEKKNPRQWRINFYLENLNNTKLGYFLVGNTTFLYCFTKNNLLLNIRMTFP